MKKKNTRGASPLKDSTDWEWLDKAADADIDVSDIPPLGEDFWREARLRLPKPKQMVSIRLDEEVLVWFKRKGPGYQTRINAVLKTYIAGMSRKSGIR